MALRKEGIKPNSRVFFSESRVRVPSRSSQSDAPSVNYRGLMDPVSSTENDRGIFYNVDNAHLLLQSPFQISDQTPMETVVEMFRKMGLRQVLVAHKG